MTVDLLIHYIEKSHPMKFVPISSTELFFLYWEPISTKLGLKYVPEFGKGLEIERDEITDVIDELQRLKKYASSIIEKVDNDAASQAILSNIDWVILALQEVQADSSKVKLIFN
ncbi:MAG: hypothetical protein ABI947_03115 [Chloroflexota bacterium]